MEKGVREKLIRVLELVLEQLAFMFGESAEKGELTREGDRFLHATMQFKLSSTWLAFTSTKEGDRFLHATMQFKRGHSGEIGIAVPSEAGVVLASNILGMEEEEEATVEKSVDALKELLNILCGQFLTAVFGEGPVFDLSVPEVRELDKAGWERLCGNTDTVGMVVEEMPLLAHASF